MAQWSGNKVNASEINNGNEYERKDRPTRQQLNAIVNNSLFALNISENVANQLSSLGSNDKVEFKGSNPNLLINGDFRINQRDQRDYNNSTAYTVDCWKNSGCWAHVNDDKSITLTHFGGWNYYYQIVQNFEWLKGKTVTLSVKVKSISYTEGTAEPKVAINDGVTTTLSEVIPNGAGGVFSVTKTISENATALFARPIQNNMAGLLGDLTVTIEWAKLEIGSVATAFSLKSYAEEMTDCFSLYRRFAPNSENSTITIGTFYAANSSAGYLIVDLGIPMVKTPELKYSSLNNIIYSLGTNAGTPFTSIGFASRSTDFTKLKYYCTGTFEAGKVYMVAVEIGTYIEFDAQS